MTEKKGALLEGKAVVSSKATGQLTVYGPLGDIDPEHPYFQLIGRIMVEWAGFEHALDVLVWDLTRHECTFLTDATVACITAQMMGPANKCEALIALMTRHGFPEDLIKRAKKLKRNCHEVQDGRNRTAHDTWFIEKETKEVGRFRKMAKRELEFGIKPESGDRMSELIDKIIKRRNEALQLRERVWYHLRETLSKTP